MSKPKPAITTKPKATDAELLGWDVRHDYPPRPSTCKDCGGDIPPARKRSQAAFAGHGRPREFCGDVCRKRHSRKVARS